MNIFQDADCFGDWSDYRSEWLPDAPTAKLRPKEKKNASCPATRRTEVHVKEIINLRALKARHRSGKDRRPDDLEDYIRKIESRGDTLPGGNFSLQQEYYRLDGFGRLYTGRGSLQNVTREARSAALSGLEAVEWDMKNAQPALLCRALESCFKGALLTGEFPLLVKFRENPYAWREGIALFYGMSTRDAKQLFFQVMFGGGTTRHADQCSLPIMEALQWEFQYARTVLVERNAVYKQICALEKTRQGACALSIFLGELENDVLTDMRQRSERAGCHVIALIFDGLILAESTGVDFDSLSVDVREIFGAAPAIKEIGVGAPASVLPSKDFCVSTTNESSIWADLFRRGQEVNEVVHTFKGGYRTCLPEAVANLAPPATAGRLADVATVGPFAFRQIEAFCSGEVFFTLVTREAPLSPGRYILYASNHAVGVEIQNCGQVKIIDPSTSGPVVLTGRDFQLFLSESSVKVILLCVFFGHLPHGESTIGRGAELLDLSAGFRKSVRDLPRYSAKRVRESPVSKIDSLLKKYASFRPSTRRRVKESHMCILCGSPTHNVTTRRNFFRDMLDRGGKGKKKMWKVKPDGRATRKILREARVWKRKGASKKAKLEWIWKSTPEDKGTYVSSGGNTITNESATAGRRQVSGKHAVGTSTVGTRPSLKYCGAPRWNSHSSWGLAPDAVAQVAGEK